MSHLGHPLRETRCNESGGQVGEAVYRITRESVAPADSERRVGGEGVKVFGVLLGSERGDCERWGG